MLERFAGEASFNVYLKMNSGMNRLGFQPHEFKRAWERLRALRCVGEITLMTHFSDADGERGIAHQLALFERYTAGLPGARSLSNSAATSNWPVAHADWIRPGIMLYGSSAMGLKPSAAELGLQATLSLTTQIIAIQLMSSLSTAGLTVGYGSAFTAEPGARIAVVACGYADGYPRHAAVGNLVGTPVVVCGVPTQLVGRVSMDMITVDVTHIPQAQVGSPVEMWGAQQPIDAVAAAAGTVGYELMCALAPRVPTVAG